MRLVVGYDSLVVFDSLTLCNKVKRISFGKFLITSYTDTITQLAKQLANREYNIKVERINDNGNVLKFIIVYIIVGNGFLQYNV